MTNALLHRIHLHTVPIVRRIAVLLLLLYFAVVVDVSRGIFGDFTTGFYYANMGTMLFPFPSFRFLGVPATAPLPPIEALIYAVFVYQGIWIAWVSLSVIYIAVPLPLWAHRTLRRSISTSARAPEENEERASVLTGVLAVLSIVLSWGTFGIDSNLDYYGVIPPIVVLGLSVTLVGFVIHEIVKPL